jgi:hypothetical protein
MGRHHRTNRVFRALQPTGPGRDLHAEFETDASIADPPGHARFESDGVAGDEPLGGRYWRSKATDVGRFVLGNQTDRDGT